MEKVRLDRVTAEKVERGLYIQRTRSTAEAAKFYQHVGVPVNVAIRVLTTPHRRDMKGYPQEAPNEVRHVLPQGVAPELEAEHAMQALPQDPAIETPPALAAPIAPMAARQSSWRDIVRSSGPTFGLPIQVRSND